MINELSRINRLMINNNPKTLIIRNKILNFILGPKIIIKLISVPFKISFLN